MRITTLGYLPVFVLVLLTAASAQDQNCSNESIKGTHGFVSSVRLVPPQNSPVKHTERARFIDVIAYDGSGNSKVGGITLAPSGKTSPYSGAGTYQIDPQRCIGSVSFQDDQNHTTKWDFVIVSGGAQLLTMIETASNTTPFSQVKR